MNPAQGAEATLLHELSELHIKANSPVLRALVEEMQRIEQAARPRDAGNIGKGVRGRWR